MGDPSPFSPNASAPERAPTSEAGISPISHVSSGSRSTSSEFDQHNVAPTTPDNSNVTPMPAWLDTSLAVMTLGLSVPAFHVGRAVSNRRAAKKAAKKQTVPTSGDPQSYVVPSSIARTATADTKRDKVMELDSSPLDPPPYTVNSDHERSSEPLSREIKTKTVAELPG